MLWTCVATLTQEWDTVVLGILLQDVSKQLPNYYFLDYNYI